FMKARDYSDTLFVNHILKYPKFWQSIRGKTLSIKNQTPLIAASLKRLKKLYPALRPAIMYFTIGGLRSGGTTDKDMVLIGSEILVGDSQTVVSEFTDEWLKSIFEAKETPDIVYLNTHEYIHTQQKDGFVNVLSQAIKEGSCDFIAELVLQQPIKTVYTDYGDAHFEAVKAAFKQDMFSDRTHWWLYNGRSKTNSAPDLGYYMGYKICQSYYQNAKNKRQAIKNIIELDYSNGVAVENFLRDSHFFSEHIDPQQLLAEYQRNLPEIVQIEPFENGSHDVPTNIRYIKITFSKPMEAVSFDFSAYGPEHFPLANIAGYENDNRTIILETVALQPQTTYDFYVNN
ncbi:MAG TPA: hypothetical protein PKH93_14545, partial [Chitinophagales bacterium]|nr:hypothetical protein [Chitinophagales bacterium]